MQHHRCRRERTVRAFIGRLTKRNELDEHSIPLRVLKPSCTNEHDRLKPLCAPVAQLDRATAFEAVGRRFESCRGHSPLHGLDRARLLSFMTDDYVLPKVWIWNPIDAGESTNLNRPTAGARHKGVLPVGKHPLQLHSLATPNGVKITLLLEELLELGLQGAEYDAWPIEILKGDQFSSGFVELNPNSKIPALLDRSTSPPTRVFESGSILLYLAEKFEHFLPKDPAQRTECLSWLFWQVGSAPFVGGGFGHFYASAPSKMAYPIDRFTMEVKRQLDVLDRRLTECEYLAGSEYTIADMAIWPWHGALVGGHLYDAATFLDVHTYANVVRWSASIAKRPATKRGVRVNRTWGEPDSQVRERHHAEDLD